MRSLRSVESFAAFVVALAVTCVWPCTGFSQQDLTFEPYTVFVAQEEAFTHCGPSEEYYRTDPLRYGQTLDVYAETETGWLGIRPPEDSFCWVPAETIETESSGGQGPGTVIEDRTVAWIGTQLGRARRYRWQVQLAKGEPVMVIGSSEREGPDGPQLWYRIVPPSGEYRWVHRDSVVMSSEELVDSVRNRAQSVQPKQLASASSSGEKTRVFVGGSDPQKPQDVFAATERSPRATPSTQGSTRSDGDSDASASESRESELAASSGQSVLNASQAIGSGLRDPQPAEPSKSKLDVLRQGGLLASLEFLTRPQIQEIGAQPQTAPAMTDVAVDSNWVAGATRPSQSASQPFGIATAGLGAPIAPSTSSGSAGSGWTSEWTEADRRSTSGANVIGQASAQAASFQSSVTQASHAFHIVSSERIAQIEQEANDADVDRLNLLLSRLMAAQASAAEIEPLERAAEELSAGALDPIIAGRARMLVETAQRYRRIATLRDGNSVIQASTTIPAGPPPSNSFAAVPSAAPVPSAAAGFNAMQSLVPTPAVTTSAPALPAGIDHGNGVMEQRGFLVQVYSARSNSPPFALTDHAGRTVAYVTPVPGVNLRPHLNSHISVVGHRGYLTGLNMPHLMATQAVRTPE